MKAFKFLLMFLVLYGASMMCSEAQKSREIQAAENQLLITSKALIEASNDFAISGQDLQIYAREYKQAQLVLMSLMMQQDVANEKNT